MPAQNADGSADLVADEACDARGICHVADAREVQTLDSYHHVGQGQNSLSVWGYMGMLNGLEQSTEHPSRAHISVVIENSLLQAQLAASSHSSSRR